jgi:hypothetical protein
MVGASIFIYHWSNALRAKEHRNKVILSINGIEIEPIVVRR